MKVKDHLGKTYSTVISMCTHYNITYLVYHYRKNLNWSLEKTLTTPMNDYHVTDHEGAVFDSKKAMCKHWNVSLTTFNNAIKVGLSLEEVLTSQSRRDIPAVDHLGNNFKSISAMCKFWGVDRRNFFPRFNRWGDVKRALTAGRYCRGNKNEE